MQETLTILKYTCDRCGTECQFAADKVPAYWVHVPECDLDFCPDCMNTIYDAAISNENWYARKFGQAPVTTHSENEYLELKRKYDQLAYEYDDLKEKYEDKMKAASFGL